MVKFYFDVKKSSRKGREMIKCEKFAKILVFYLLQWFY